MAELSARIKSIQQIIINDVFTTTIHNNSTICDYYSDYYNNCTNEQSNLHAYLQTFAMLQNIKRPNLI